MSLRFRFTLRQLLIAWLFVGALLGVTGNDWLQCRAARERSRVVESLATDLGGTVAWHGIPRPWSLFWLPDNSLFREVFFVDLSLDPDQARLSGKRRISHQEEKLIKVLSHIPLKSVHLSFTDLNDDVADKLPGSENIESVSMLGTDISGRGLAWIARLPNLESLTISGQGITDDGMGHLLKCAELDRLYLTATSISDKGLAILSGHSAISHLNLSFSKQVSDDGVAHLSRMNLVSLHLDYTLVTDRSIDYLGEMKELRYLGIQRTKITADGVARLQKMLPSTKIRWQPAWNISPPRVSSAQDGPLSVSKHGPPGQSEESDSTFKDVD